MLSIIRSRRIALVAVLCVSAIALQLHCLARAAAGTETTAAPKSAPKIDFERYRYKYAIEREDWDGALDIRAWRLEPKRRDSPLRYENISDEEVREVQLAAAEFLPRDYVNINGVVNGCPCEDGPKCTNQVWIVARKFGSATGLLLSRIDGHWVVGPVQRWYLRYKEMERRHARTANYEQRLKDREESRQMLEELPACESPLPAP